MYTVRTIAFSLVLLFSVLVFSCAKEKAIAVRPPDPCATPLTFVADIQPIFQTNCAIGQCHVAGSLYAPFDATNYDTLDYFINNGALLNALRHTGVIKMPRNNPADPTDISSTPLADSVIQKISCWIEQGFPKE